MEIHILLIEEEYHSRYTITVILENAGYRVTAVDDAENGLQYIELAHKLKSFNLSPSSIDQMKSKFLWKFFQNLNYSLKLFHRLKNRVFRIIVLI